MGFDRNHEGQLENKSKTFIKKLKLSPSLSSVNGQLAYPDTGDGELDAAEYFFRCGVEAAQRIECDRFFNTLNRLLLALVYSKKGDWAEAAALGKKALQDASSQAGVIMPICEMILGAIFMENGNRKEALKHLENSVALLREMNRQESLAKTGNGSPPARVKPIRSVIDKENAFQEESDSAFFRIQMFGPFRVFFGNDELDPTGWRTVKSRDLLAYLAHQNKPVGTDQILEDLWPDLEPDKASALFHTTLYYLRRLLQQFTDEEIIIRGSKRYQLKPGSVLIDRRQFEAVAQRTVKKTMNAVLANELEAVVPLYRGDYLEDLDYQWVIPVQEELRNIYSDLKQRLAVYYLQNKQYLRALVHLRQLMTQNPYSEEVLRLLLRTLAEMGDILALKKQYAIFVKTVLNELGIKPSSELTAFYKELCAVKPAQKHA
ncbi:MAG: hypothetical protein GX075_07980 [Firmicutes bacterium]|nr:hypothetical protein [Bacillota bacterium]